MIRGSELDPRQRSQLVEDSQGLVHAVARPFVGAHALDDLVQEGNVGLLKAVEKFNPERGSWATYATWWIRSYVVRFMRREPAVHTSPGRRPVSLTILSLDATGTADDETPLIERLEATGPGADDELGDHQVRQRVRDALGRLGAAFSGLPMAIVRERLMREDAVTLEQLGERFGVSRERVRQVEVRVRELLARHLAPVQALAEGES